jgi:transposase-like protein
MTDPLPPCPCCNAGELEATLQEDGKVTFRCKGCNESFSEWRLWWKLQESRHSE